MRWQLSHHVVQTNSTFQPINPSVVCLFECTNKSVHVAHRFFLEVGGTGCISIEGYRLQDFFFFYGFQFKYVILITRKYLMWFLLSAGRPKK